MRSHHRAFTLIELLVVMAIIGLLVALLLPAVQAAREAARRVLCKSNLKQIGLALHNYHDVHLMFPINYGTGAYNESDRGASWLVRVLPFVEQSALYSTLKFGVALTDPANDAAAKTVVTAFLCPTDAHGNGVMPNRRGSTVPRAITNYKACLGGNWEWGPFSPRTSISGRNANETNGLELCNGFLCRGGDRPPFTTTMADIQDGTSTTFAVGEAVPEWTWHTWWYFFNASTATCAVPLNHWRKTESSLADWFENYSFASRHTGGGHFLLVDGSVRFVSENVAETVYRHAATIQSSDVVGEW